MEASSDVRSSLLEVVEMIKFESIFGGSRA